VLLLANLAMFALLLSAGSGWDGSNTRPYLSYGAIHRSLIADGQYWRLLSAAFLHFGIIHLALNMWALWDVGRLSERLFGPVAYLLIYAASAAIGGAASILVHGDAAISAGASGAIFGLCGALGALMLHNRHVFPPRILKRLAASVGAMVAYSLFLGFTKDGIDNAAHIGGMLGGALLGGMLSFPLEQKLPERAARRWVLAGLASILLIGIVVYGATHRDPAWEAEQDARRALAFLAREDDRLLSVGNDVLIHARAAELPVQIEIQLARPWDAVAAELGRHAVPSLERVLRAARRYAILQAAFWRSYARKVSTNAPDWSEWLRGAQLELDIARRAALGR